MKNLLSMLVLLFLLLGSACNQSKTAGENAEGEQTEALTGEETTAADEEEPEEDKSKRPSPPRETRATIGAVNVVIDYGSPSVKGRQIWGGLVPYGEVWRTGANEATTIEFSADVMIEGKPLAAGRYSLFTIPAEGKWTVIFNTVADQWGAYEYDADKDALRVEVTPRPLSAPAEALEIAVEGNTVVVRWENLAIPFQVKG